MWTKKLALAGLTVATAMAGAARAEVVIAERQRIPVDVQRFTLGPGEIRPRSLNLSRGDTIQATVHLDAASTPDVSAYVCPRREYDAFMRDGAIPERGCTGFYRGGAGGTVTFTAPYGGEYVYFVDNTFSMFSSKAVTSDLWIETNLDDVTREELRAPFQALYEGLERGLEFEPFDIAVAPCGQPNAFSDTRTGNIVVCGELLFQAQQKGEADAVTGILLHELGHTLLNLWGLPNYRNEQTVDEFATVMLVMGGQEEVAERYLAFFADANTRAEAAHAEENHSPHPLSVQRMRNVGHIIDQPSDYIERWRPLIYRHMTTEQLQAETVSEAALADPELAKQILAERSLSVAPNRPGRATP